MQTLTLKSKAIFAMLVVFSISTSVACMCIYMGKFQVFAQSHPIVVRGTISKHGDALRINPEYFKDMTIAVTDVVKGDFPHTSFEFYGDTGMSCLRYITADDYPIGSEHLFILSDNSAVQPLMVCGESSVLIQGNTVVGRESFENIL